ncbi:hypothetical protein [Salinigranum marinum]|uniref:hypothetical protein n=1 Tax=Salinigranum marinum TaxID=1515595 RepID=UPI002989AABC|nr:hypothetical protein [Salinigranum marinum]
MNSHHQVKSIICEILVSKYISENASVSDMNADRQRRRTTRSRRSIMKIVGLGISVAIAGCSGDGRPGDGEIDDGGTNGSESTNEPKTVIEIYLNTFFGGDPTGFNKIRHSDSPISAVEEDQQLIDINVSIDNVVYIVEETDRILAEVTTVSDGEDMEPVTATREIELRTEDGQWKFWYDSALD